MKITIHQPEHIPWLGLIDKINQVDVFVILDTVQFEKNYFQNRNKIRTGSQKNFSWLTVPIKKQSLKTKIKDIRISYDFNWQNRYLNIIKENYKNSKYFDTYFPKIEKIIEKNHKKLVDLNRELILFILKEFNVKTKIVLASSLNTNFTENKTDKLLQLCKILKANLYLSGPSGKDYLESSLFEKANIKISFHQFEHPKYKQIYKPFISAMSSVDLLFNYGPSAKKILFEK